MNFLCPQVKITGSSLYEEIRQKGELLCSLPQKCNVRVHDHQHYTIVILLQVNVVPIIAKADTIAKSELKQFKEKVREKPVNIVEFYPEGTSM